MGYLTQAQMHHAAERYRLGISRDEDQQVLSKSTIYQHFIHALQNSKLERTLENLSKNIAKSDKVGQPDIAV